MGALVSIFHPLHIVSVESLIVRGTRVLVTWTIAQKIQRRNSMLKVSSMHVFCTLGMLFPMGNTLGMLFFERFSKSTSKLLGNATRAICEPFEYNKLMYELKKTNMLIFVPTQ